MEMARLDLDWSNMLQFGFSLFLDWEVASDLKFKHLDLSL